jgi:predicted DNA-binding protein
MLVYTERWTKESAMQTQTVRLSAEDHAALSELARNSGKPLSAILSEAIQEL